MKRLLLLTLLAATSIMAQAQTQILLRVADRTLTATLADTEAARQLASELNQAPITVQMSDYGGFEKVGSLPHSFPTADTRITTNPGDIMLYQGNNIVIFYGSNTWAYTPLGKIDNASAAEIKAFLGAGTISLELLPSGSTAIRAQKADAADAPAYDLHGRRLAAHARGLRITTGQKKY